VPGLRLSADEQAGLAKLQALSTVVASNFLSAIKSAAIKADTDGLTIADLPEIPELSKTDAKDILDAVVSVYHVRAYSEVELDEFVDDVCESMESSERKDFSSEKGDIQQFRVRIREFLGLDEVDRAAKSNVLRYEQERTVHRVRILTDARPIFGDDATETPKAAVIIHTLKIGYHHNDDVEEVFFSLDESDLEELGKAVQRAALKATSLRSMLATAKVKVFNLG
jgi:hypothetical protein